MEPQLSETEIREHNRLYGKGWSLAEGLLLKGGRPPPRRLGSLSRRRLLEAMRCFEGALDIAPGSWQSLWALGKIQQRLGNPREALDYLGRAHELAPAEPDVAREAGIAATDAGDGQAAIRFTRAAIAARPDDPSLVSNLALALLISGELEDAQAAAAEATSRSPGDRIADYVRSLVDEVAQGKRVQPRSGLELR